MHLPLTSPIKAKLILESMLTGLLAFRTPISIEVLDTPQPHLLSIYPPFWFSTQSRVSPNVELLLLPEQNRPKSTADPLRTKMDFSDRSFLKKRFRT